MSGQSAKRDDLGEQAARRRSDWAPLRIVVKETFTALVDMPVELVPDSIRTLQQHVQGIKVMEFLKSWGPFVEKHVESKGVLPDGLLDRAMGLWDAFIARYEFDAEVLASVLAALQKWKDSLGQQADVVTGSMRNAVLAQMMVVIGDKEANFPVAEFLMRLSFEEELIASIGDLMKAVTLDVFVPELIKWVSLVRSRKLLVLMRQCLHKQSEGEAESTDIREQVLQWGASFSSKPTSGALSTGATVFTEVRVSGIRGISESILRRFTWQELSSDQFAWRATYAFVTVSVKEAVWQRVAQGKTQVVRKIGGRSVVLSQGPPKAGFKPY